MSKHLETLQTFLEKNHNKLTPFIGRADCLALLKRSWQAKSGREADNDFKTNPPHSKKGEPLKSQKKIIALAKAAQFIQVVKREFGNQNEVYQRVKDFLS